MYAQHDSNIRKTWFLMTTFFVVVIGLGWIFSYFYQDPSILYIFVVVSIFMNIISYWYSDKVVLSMYRAVPVTNESHPDLYNLVENLSITAGLPMPKVYVIPDGQPNAFATGRNKNHAAVAVTSGLLQIMNKTELEGVIAHEMSHIGNMDMLLSTVVVVLVGFITLISDFFIRSRGMMRGRDEQGNQVQGILFLIGIILAILSPIAATLIQLAISRKREFLADASGVLLTRYPEGLASALEKIGQYGTMPMVHASNATAHLFISNPFGAGLARPGTAGVRALSKVSKLSRLFMTHPPIEKRIEILRGMN